jgi:hypothetical protein
MKAYEILAVVGASIALAANIIIICLLAYVCGGL